jgi:hypothetical protein
MAILKVKAAVSVIVLMITASCGLTDLSGPASGQGSDNIWGGPPDYESDAGILDQVAYMTVLDYKKGYDWRMDPAKGSVKCSLVVYADGRPVMKVPVGDEYETASDPDMHRLVEGHLYTDYSTDSETVIKKDGALLFRYPGREIICGVEVSDSSTYTLGQNRSGSGFSFRQNGEVILQRQYGAVMGGLKRINGTLSFAFYDSIRAQDSNVDRYYIVNDGEVSQVAVREDIVKVWDVMNQGGTVSYVATLTGVAFPVFFHGESKTVIPLPLGSVLISAALTGGDGTICAELVFRTGNEILSALWKEDVGLRIFGKGQTVAALTVTASGLYCAVNPSGTSAKGLVYRNGEVSDMPEDYTCVGRNAMSMVNGMLHVGLSSKSGGKPVVWNDGQLDTLDINGYISSICVR